MTPQQTQELKTILNTPGKGVDEVVAYVRELLNDQLDTLYKKFDEMIPEERAKEIGDQFMIFRGVKMTRSCPVCGIEPETQRDMLLTTVEDMKSVGEK